MAPSIRYAPVDLLPRVCPTCGVNLLVEALATADAGYVVVCAALGGIAGAHQVYACGIGYRLTDRLMIVGDRE